MTDRQALLQQATTFINRAVTEDNKGECASALQNYLQGLSIFAHLIRYEKNASLRKNLIDHTAGYVARAEEIKLWMQQQQQQHQQPRSGSPGGSDGSPPSGRQGVQEGDNLDKDTQKLYSEIEACIVHPGEKKTTLKDIAGLEDVKQVLNEAIVLPLQFSEWFEEGREPWSAILMHGPPGTGKSKLAEAVAHEANSTFFNVGSSVLMSKWQGQSEKMVKALFEVARKKKPSIIFIDEIDSLCGSRGDGENESSKRVKNELLTQMQGVGSDNHQVLVIGATNLPWEIDAGFRRRFEKRIYVGLPTPQARLHILRVNLRGVYKNMQDNELQGIVDATEGYSGSDMTQIAKTAKMEPIRCMQRATHFAKNEEGKYAPCSKEHEGAEERSLSSFKQEEVVKPLVTLHSLQVALEQCKPTVSPEEITRYLEYAKSFDAK